MNKKEKITKNVNLTNSNNGITLISLVITIIILLILAGVTLSLTLGDNGIINQAQNAKEAQEIAAIKEDIQLAILDKEIEKGGEGLTEEELEEILKDYGEIQEDGNTIKTDEGYEIDIDEIYKPGAGGGDAATDEELAALLEKIKELEQTVTDLTNTKTELEGTIEDLNRQLEEEQGNNSALQEQIENLQGQVDTLNKTIEQQQSTIDSLNTQIAELQKKQSTGNAVAADVLSGKTFSNGTQVGLKGSMPNLNTNSKITHTSSNGTKVILGDAAYATTNSDGVNRFQIRYNSTPGYLPGNTLIALDYAKVASAIGLTGNKIVAGNTILGVAGTDKGYNNGYNAGVTAADNRANPNSTNYKTGYNAGYSAGRNSLGGYKTNATIPCSHFIAVLTASGSAATGSIGNASTISITNATKVNANSYITYSHYSSSSGSTTRSFGGAFWVECTASSAQIGQTLSATINYGYRSNSQNKTGTKTMEVKMIIPLS